MLDAKLPLSLQYQLKNSLLEHIKGGEWQLNCLIPSERELCEQYGVSRITVREAIKELVSQGYLNKKQGKGTFVSSLNPRIRQSGENNNILSQVIEDRGLESEFRLLNFSRCCCSEQLQKRLSLPEFDEIYEVTRVRYVNGLVCALEKVYLPCSVIEGVNIEKAANSSFYLTILQSSGLSAGEAEEEFEAIECPEDIAKILNIEKDSAILRVIRLTKAAGRYIEYSESYLHGEKYRYRHVLNLSTT